jgi:hypothetical protein
MNPAALLAITVPKDAASATTNVATAIISSAGMKNPNNKNSPIFTSGNGPYDPLEFTPQVHYAVSSTTVKSLKIKKSASSPPTATYNRESDNNNNNQWDQEGWVSRTKVREQKSTNTVSG